MERIARAMGGRSSSLSGCVSNFDAHVYYICACMCETTQRMCKRTALVSLETRRRKCMRIVSIVLYYLYTMTGCYAYSPNEIPIDLDLIYSCTACCIRSVLHYRTLLRSALACDKDAQIKYRSCVRTSPITLTPVMREPITLL